MKINNIYFKKLNCNMKENNEDLLNQILLGHA